MNLVPSDYFGAFAISALVFFVFDFLWLTWVAKDLYGKQLKHKLKSPMNYKIIALFYVVFVIGLNYFAIIPAINQSSLEVAGFSGLLYGFFTYTTYDLTNYATLKNWPKKVVIVDIVWGSLLAMFCAVVTYNIFIGTLG